MGIFFGIAPGFNETKEQALAWLEKLGNKPQGKSALEAIREEKVDNANKIEPKDYSSIDPHFGKPIDKVESKFKVGDWITNGDYTWKIISVDNFDYALQNQWGEYAEDTIVYVNDVFHLWTLQDAKDGDVLSIAWHEGNNSWEKIIIFKKYHNKGVKGLISSPCVEGYGDTFKNGKLVLHEEVPYYSKTWTSSLHPATKEQCDLLFTKMKEAGYKWDAEKKELIKEEVK